MDKYMFFLGKGGVGKSTVSAATACELSRSRKVLHVSLDPAHNLGDIYGKSLSDEPALVAPNLYAQEVNLSLWMDRYLQWSRDEMKRQYRYHTAINLDSFFDILKYSPGTEEYAVLWALENICRDGQTTYDTIVFDTPPTALSLRFLAMPAVSIRWVEELTKMREAILVKRQTILHINPDSEAVRGASKKEDDPVHHKLGSLRTRLEYMYNLFSRHSYFVVVMNEDRLSLAESIRIGEELQRLRFSLSAVCLNKTGCVDVGETSGRIREVFPLLPLFVAETVPGGIVSPEDLGRVQVRSLADHYLSTSQAAHT